MYHCNNPQRKSELSLQTATQHQHCKTIYSITYPGDPY